MNLSPSSPFVKLAYIFTFADEKPGRWNGPEKSSLCILFWRCVLNLFVIFAVTVVMLFLLYHAILEWRTALAVIGIICGALLTVISVGSGISIAYNKIQGSQSPVIAWVKAKKAGICPIIKFVDEDDESEPSDEELEPIDAIINYLDRKD